MSGSPTTAGTGAALAVMERFASGSTGTTMLRPSDQPPETLPPSLPASSWMKSAQVPFGTVPLKDERDATGGPDGAGAGKMSPTGSVPEA